jgi:23S rRNA (uracil1939-C5)-methyltransferase
VSRAATPGGDCPHRPTCPGCPRFGATDASPEALAILDALAQASGTTLAAPVLGARRGFRMRARLAVRGRARSPKIGVFQAGSHRIADIPRCPIHHPAINEVAAGLRRAIRRTATAPYVESTGRGSLRYAQIAVERSSGKALLTLVTNEQSPEPSRALFEAINEEAGGSLLGLWWNGNTARTNTILGPHWRHIAGREETEETIGGARVGFPPWAFGQSNLDLADAIVATVHEAVGPAATVAEFHAGVGAIGLGLLGRGATLRANELSEGALASMRRRATAIGGGGNERLVTVAGNAGDASHLLDGVDVAIVDPPRKGLDEGLRRALIATPPPRLIYVACGIPALAADIERLVASGVWKVVGLQPFDLFPFTDHLEAVAILERRPTRGLA